MPISVHRKTRAPKFESANRKKLRLIKDFYRYYYGNNCWLSIASILSAWRRMQPKMLPGTAIERADEAFHRAGRRYVRLHMHAGFVLAKDADFLPADPTLRCID